MARNICGKCFSVSGVRLDTDPTRRMYLLDTVTSGNVALGRAQVILHQYAILHIAMADAVGSI